MKYILYIFMLFLSVSSFAGSAVGKVKYFQVGHGYTPQNVYVVVEIEGVRSSKPECATDDRFAFNPTTEAGKLFSSTLMAAQLSKSDVEIYGINTCNVMASEFEDINFMRLK